MDPNTSSKMTPVSIILSILLLIEFTLFFYLFGLLINAGGDVGAELILITLVTLGTIILAVFAMIVLINSSDNVKMAINIINVILIIFIGQLIFLVINLIMSNE